jgi:flagellar protein FlaG
MLDTSRITDATAVAARTAEIQVPALPSATRTPAQLRPSNAAGPTPELRVEDFTAGELREVATAFGDVVSLVNRDLRISVDESTGRIVTQIVDSETKEVVRQLPPEALLDVARRVADLVGLLLDEES